MITEKQKVVLQFIHDYYTDNFYPPSIQEIAKSQTVACNSIQGHVEALDKKGYITKKPGKARSIVLTPKGREAL
jgi:repressor LexA